MTSLSFLLLPTRTKIYVLGERMLNFTYWVLLKYMFLVFLFTFCDKQRYVYTHKYGIGNDVFCCCFFSVRLLSVLRGHSFFFQPMMLIYTVWAKPKNSQRCRAIEDVDIFLLPTFHHLYLKITILKTVQCRVHFRKREFNYMHLLKWRQQNSRAPFIRRVFLFANRSNNAHLSTCIVNTGDKLTYSTYQHLQIDRQFPSSSSYS